MFEIGDILKFSEDGLHRWTGGDKKRMSACRRWRWLLKGLSVQRDRFGNHLLSLERLDIPSKVRVVWSYTFFEKAEDRAELEGQP